MSNFIKVDKWVKKGLSITEITVKVNDFHIDDFVVTQADWESSYRL